MKIKELLDGVNFKFTGKIENNKDISGISYDSRKSKEGDIFVCLIGYKSDGHDYIKNAYEKGARVFLISKDVDIPDDAIGIMVEDTRKTLSKISSNFFKNPSKKLKIIGITGTKGKTSTTHMVFEILNNLGYKTGSIGTRGVIYSDKIIETDNTTPESYEIFKFMTDMIADGITHLVMEVSSAALMSYRVEDIDFDIAVFTNLYHDHVGGVEHPTFEHYMKSKMRLFSLSKKSLINLDDKYSKNFLGAATGELKTYSLKMDANYICKNLDTTIDGNNFNQHFDFFKNNSEVKTQVSIPLIGEFNVYNSLVSICISDILGLDTLKAAEVLKNIVIPGRMEIMQIKSDFMIVLDYAHNEVSMENALKSLRKICKGRLICLFGTVGDRSEARRVELPRAVEKYADIAIATSDNPGFENPDKIIDEMLVNFTNKNVEVIKEVDRKKAIEIGLDIAKKDDIFLLAGKGGETVQQIRGIKHYFNEKEIIKEYLK